MILVTGANGIVGHPLCAYFDANCIAYKSVSRSVGHSVHWDLQQPADEQMLQELNGTKTVIHCAPIWLLPAHLDNLSRIGVKQLIVFSSTSAISKRHSNDANEIALVERLLTAENDLQGFCSMHDLSLVLLRPSMIYGYGRDQNIMQIAKFIRTYGMAVLAGQARGLRQPVHAEDLVRAVLAVKDNTKAAGSIYSVAGGEVLSYREMVERIFLGLGKKVRILHIPIPIYRLLLRFAAKLRRFSYTAEMANRMSQDLVYDNSPAQVDFDYQPQLFLQNPQRDLLKSIDRRVDV